MFTHVRHPLVKSIALLCSVLFLLITASVHAQSVSDVSFSPASGAPGTTINLLNSNFSFSYQCYIGSDLVNLPAAGLASYTVPGSAAPGSTLNIGCYITSVDTLDPIGTFTVTAPPPTSAPDSDGDGIPDPADACPQQFAQTQNGCPDPTPVPDTDGDGVPDPADACPQQFAQTQNGCPDQPTVTQPLVATATVTPQPTIAIENIQPQNNACAVTSSGQVNIRQSPSTDATIIAVMQAGRAYAVDAVTADSGWYRLSAVGGWVSATVVAQSGDCSGISVLSVQAQVAATPTAPPRVVRQAPVRYNVSDLLAACNDSALLTQAARLNFQGILRLAQERDPAARCELARRLLGQMAFMRTDNPSVYNFTALAGQCAGAFGIGALSREQAAAFMNFQRTLREVNREIWNAVWAYLSRETDAGRRCDVLRLQQQALWWPTYDVNAGDLDLRMNAWMTMTVASCPAAWRLSPERVQTTIIQLRRAGFDPGYYGFREEPQYCDLINEVHQLGTLSEDQVWLFASLVQGCGYNRFRQEVRNSYPDLNVDPVFEDRRASAANLVNYAAGQAVNIAALRADPVQSVQLCRETMWSLNRYRVSLADQRTDARENTDPQSYTPAAFRDCPAVFRALERHGSELTPAELLSLLRSPTACNTAYRWVNYRSPVPYNLGAARVCFTGYTVALAVPASTGGIGQVVEDAPTTTRIGGDLPITRNAPLGSLVFTESFVYTRETPFRGKLAAVDTDVNAICVGFVVVDERLTIDLTPTATIDLSNATLTRIDVGAFLDVGALAPITPAPTPSADNPLADCPPDLFTDEERANFVSRLDTILRSVAESFGLPPVPVEDAVRNLLTFPAEARCQTARDILNAAAPAGSSGVTPASPGLPGIDLTTVDLDALLRAGVLPGITPEVTPMLGEPPLDPGAVGITPDAGAAITPEVVPGSGGVTAVPGGVTPVGEVPGGTTPVPAGVTPVVEVPGGATVVPGSSGSDPIPLPTTPAPRPTVDPVLATSVALLPTPAPLSEAEIADVRTLVEEIGGFNLSTSLADDVLAVFDAIPADGATDAPADLYLLTALGAQALTENTPESELYPALSADGTRVAFVQISPTGERTLQLLDLTTLARTTVFTGTLERTVGLFAPAWSPDGNVLFATLIDSTGATGIYALSLVDLTDPAALPTPILVAEGAAAPALTPDGQFMAYTVGTGTQRDVVVMLMTSGLTQPITEQPEGSTCDAPSFDNSGLTLYFTCVAGTERALYRYDLDGLAEIPTTAPGGQPLVYVEASAGPESGLLTLGDGGVISLVNDVGNSAPLPVVQLENLRARHLRWFVPARENELFTQ